MVKKRLIVYWDLLYSGMTPDPAYGATAFLDLEQGAVVTIYEEEWQCLGAGGDLSQNQKNKFLLATFPHRYVKLAWVQSHTGREREIDRLAEYYCLELQ